MKIGDFCKTNALTYSPKEGWPEINYLDTGNITENHIIEIQHLVVGKDEIPSRARRKVQQEDIVYSTVRPNQLHYGIITAPMHNMLVSTGFVVISVDRKIADPYYIYFFLTQKDIVEQLQAIGSQSTSAYPSIKPTDIENIDISLPSLETQKAIGRLLWAIEEKAAINQQINDNLQQQAQALYKSWFVDFEPFEGIAPAGWKSYHLADFLPVITGKKNANVSSDKGLYPFFSCSQDYAWTDEYSFDGSAILVAGNGDFNVKFYCGKFEAYQRSYVLIPYNPSYTAWLFYAVQYNLSKITSAARGSVIKFITKGNLEDFEFMAPNNPNSLPVIDTLSAINNQIAANNDENIKLAELRDSLLPKLMSGEIDVSDVKV